MCLDKVINYWPKLSHCVGYKIFLKEIPERVHTLNQAYRRDIGDYFGVELCSSSIMPTEGIHFFYNYLDAARWIDIETGAGYWRWSDGRYVVRRVACYDVQLEGIWYSRFAMEQDLGVTYNYRCGVAKRIVLLQGNELLAD
ncbi:MAG: hypothetical protein WC449_05270 [Candidatus Paceibacterota bacterium]